MQYTFATVQNGQPKPATIHRHAAKKKSARQSKGHAQPSPQIAEAYEQHAQNRSLIIAFNGTTQRNVTTQQPANPIAKSASGNN